MLLSAEGEGARGLRRDSGAAARGRPGNAQPRSARGGAGFSLCAGTTGRLSARGTSRLQPNGIPRWRNWLRPRGPCRTGSLTLARQERFLFQRPHLIPALRLLLRPVTLLRAIVLSWGNVAIRVLVVGCLRTRRRPREVAVVLVAVAPFGPVRGLLVTRGAVGRRVAALGPAGGRTTVSGRVAAGPGIAAGGREAGLGRISPGVPVAVRRRGGRRVSVPPARGRSRVTGSGGVPLVDGLAEFVDAAGLSARLRAPVRGDGRGDRRLRLLPRRLLRVARLTGVTGGRAPAVLGGDRVAAGPVRGIALTGEGGAGRAGGGTRARRDGAVVGRVPVRLARVAARGGVSWVFRVPGRPAAARFSPRGV